MSRKIESTVSALTYGRVVIVVSQKFLSNDIRSMYSKYFSNYFKRIYWVVKNKLFYGKSKVNIKRHEDKQYNEIYSGLKTYYPDQNI